MPTYYQQSGDPHLTTADEYNAKVIAWNARLRSRILADLQLLTNEEKQKTVRKLYRSSTQRAKYNDTTPTMEQPLIPSLKSREFTGYGEVYGISQSFSKHGIYVHYGVGKGHPRGSSSMVLTGKERRPVDWLNKNILSIGPELEAIVNEYYGDKALVAVYSMLIKSKDLNNTSWNNTMQSARGAFE